jgi:hypothetical protein
VPMRTRSRSVVTWNEGGPSPGASESAPMPTLGSPSKTPGPRRPRRPRRSRRSRAADDAASAVKPLPGGTPASTAFRRWPPLDGDLLARAAVPPRVHNGDEERGGAVREFEAATVVAAPGLHPDAFRNGTEPPGPLPTSGWHPGTRREAHCRGARDGVNAPHGYGRCGRRTGEPSGPGAGTKRPAARRPRSPGHPAGRPRGTPGRAGAPGCPGPFPVFPRSLDSVPSIM